MSGNINTNDKQNKLHYKTEVNGVKMFFVSKDIKKSEERIRKLFTKRAIEEYWAKQK